MDAGFPGIVARTIAPRTRHSPRSVQPWYYYSHSGLNLCIYSYGPGIQRKGIPLPTLRSLRELVLCLGLQTDFALARSFEPFHIVPIIRLPRSNAKGGGVKETRRKNNYQKRENKQRTPCLELEIATFSW